MSIELVISSNHPSSAVPFSSCLQSFPASGSFLRSQFFTSGRQSIGASASVLPMNIQDWFLGLSGWISLLSMGLSRVFSNTTVQKHHFFSAQLSLLLRKHKSGVIPTLLHLLKLLSAGWQVYSAPILDGLQTIMPFLPDPGHASGLFKASPHWLVMAYKMTPV